MKYNDFIKYFDNKIHINCYNFPIGQFLKIEGNLKEEEAEKIFINCLPIGLLYEYKQNKKIKTYKYKTIKDININRKKFEEFLSKNNMKKLQIIISGKPKSMYLRKNYKTGNSYYIKSKQYKDYKQDFVSKYKLNYGFLYGKPLLENSLYIRCVYYINKQKNNNLEKFLISTFDCLNEANVLKNKNINSINFTNCSIINDSITEQRVEISIYYEEKKDK